ncbi:MAG: response regulator [Candidatus Cloacimonetes bacterium]|nr:response regulator [Candidatus Cloacimonadota bacterium]
MPKTNILFYESSNRVLKDIQNDLDMQSIEYLNSLESVQAELSNSSNPTLAFLDMKDQGLTPSWLQNILGKPKLEVVLLNSSSHHNSLMKMMEIGISHFLPLGYTASQVKLLIQQLSSKYKTTDPSESNQQNSMTRGDILIVDDEEILLEVLGDFLESSNFYVNTIDQPLQVLEAIQTKKYDVVLMDINMPNMNGIEVCKQIKGYDPSLFVVGMTGAANDDEVNQLLEAGAFTCLKKPFEMKKFQKILDKLVFISQDEKLKEGPEDVNYRPKTSSVSSTTKYLLYTTIVTVLLLFLAEQFFMEKSLPEKNPNPNNKPDIIYNMMNNQSPDLDALKRKLELLNR